MAPDEGTCARGMPNSSLLNISTAIVPSPEQARSVMPSGVHAMSVTACLQVVLSAMKDQDKHSFADGYAHPLCIMLKRELTLYKPLSAPAYNMQRGALTCDHTL